MPTAAPTDFTEQLLDHVPDLRRYARVLANSKDRADDLVQDCLERALTRAALYQPGTNLRAWLFTVMRNVWITQCRRAKLQHDYISDRLMMARSFEGPTQIDKIALKESLQLVRELSRGEREAVTLLALQDLSYEEAASSTGLPVGTMKSRLSRGRQHLRDLSGMTTATREDAVLEDIVDPPPPLSKRARAADTSFDLSPPTIR